MTWFTEPTLKHALWSSLESRGYKTGAEVWLTPSERIDILFADGAGQYVGIEVKDLDSLWGLGRREKIRGQVSRYLKSGTLDGLYLAAVSSGWGEAEFGSILRQFPMVGEICVPQNDVLAPDFDFWRYIRNLPTPLVRSSTPTIRSGPEDELKHRLWKWYRASGERVMLEGTLPNTSNTGSALVRIDMAVFRGTDPQGKPVIYAEEVLENSDSTELVGVEVKASISSGSELSRQLEAYLAGGCLTSMYLAVRDVDVGVATSILSRTFLDRSNPVNAVGIIAIPSQPSTEPRVIKTARRLEIRHDGILINRRGLNGKVTKEVLHPVWGYPVLHDEKVRPKNPVEVWEDSIVYRAMR